MEEQYFIDLIDRYLAGKADKSEILLVEEYYKRLSEKGKDLSYSKPDSVIKEEILVKLKEQIYESANESSLFFRRKYYYAWAASIILVLSFSLFFYKQKDNSNQTLVQIKTLKANDVAPGGNKAILTLADGSKIVLDEVRSGEIAVQSGISITKTSDGKLIYENVINKIGVLENRILYNQIETPKGGQYQINLPDGSKVWLNAASSLKYPAIFNGNERQVELVGEAYFEVFPNAEMPFRVSTKHQLVEVLGTHFNVNAYSNESVTRTTLIEGSVKVSEKSLNNFKYLKPGEEAKNKNGIILVHEANIEQAIAWHKGNFQFNDTYLIDILKQIERWYDVKVDYSKVPDTRYNANISRNLNLSRVLEVLELTGKVKFSIEDNIVKVSNVK